ncbi:MAG: hypothetical protein ACRBC3_09045 [Burkholderiaceae bacterium]
MNLTTKLFAMGIFLLVIACAPWLLLNYAGHSGGVTRVGFILVAIGLVVLILDLVRFKTISHTFGAFVNQATSASSFSGLRIAYLLLVYITPVSAVLGLFAWARH